MSGHVMNFKDKDGDKDKSKNNKLSKNREKYQTILSKTEDLQNIEVKVLPVYYDRYIKTKIKT